MLPISVRYLCRNSKRRMDVSIIWKDLLWRADLYRLYKHRGGCTIPLFQSSVWCEKCVAARHYSVIGKQLYFANNRNRVCGAVLCLSQDGACTNLFTNFSENSLKGYLSNDTTLNPLLFSLVNTFKLLKSSTVKLAWFINPIPGGYAGKKLPIM